VSEELAERDDIARLLWEGYTVSITIELKVNPEDSGGIPSHYYLIAVWKDSVIVGRGGGFLFLDAMIAAYGSTPEKPEAEQGRLL
jgi:hypothetical protein